MKTRFNLRQASRLTQSSNPLVERKTVARKRGTGVTPALLLLALLIASPLRAQIVADGATNTLSNVTTNITGNVTVGTNGSFTLLVLSDNALLTNSANGNIGLNATAKSNEVRLLSPSSRWQMGAVLFVGSSGSSSRLVVSNGALVENSGSAIGTDASSSNNSVVVTGSGSLWSNRGDLTVGYSGRNNQLFITNGGWTASRNGYVGRQSGSSNNLVVVSGIGSVWSNQFDLEFAYKDHSNRMVIEAGGLVSSDNGRIGSGGDLVFGTVPINNEVLVTGAGSLWTNQSAVELNNALVGGFNQLVVSNGAAVLSGGPGAVGGTANKLVITGAGSRWANQSDFTLGGSGNQLAVSEGAGMVCSNATVGSLFLGGDDTVLLTGTGTTWTNRGDLAMGLGSGVRSVLVISNGASAFSGGNSAMGINSGANFNSVSVTDPGSRWVVASNLYVGSNGALSRLTINNGALVENEFGSIGVRALSSNNEVTVSGAGSRWTNRNSLYVGESGAGNRLVVSNGGLVYTSDGWMGKNASSTNNEAVITGAGSLWTMPTLTLASGSRLVVSNGGRVRNFNCYMGVGVTGGDNEARVTGPGSSWTNESFLFVGQNAKGNRLVITNEGAVFASGLGVLVGNGPISTNNRIVVDGGTLRATNLAGNSFLDVLRGTNVLNAGLVETDLLVLTNTQGFCEFNGGTLITRGAVISNGVPFTVGRNGTTPAIWDVRAGVTNTFIGGDLIIGSNAPFNQLILTNGALLTNFGTAYLGWDLGGASNSVTLAGIGSQWLLDDGVTVGAFGPANRLVVSNGASLVTGGLSAIGLQAYSSNNEAVVTGPGSSWTSGPGLMIVGYNGHDSRLLVSDGGLVASYAGYFGFGLAVGSNNLAVVTGAGSTWSNAFELRVGHISAGNRLIVSNGAVVSAGTNVHVGFGSASTNNRVTVDGGTLRTTNGSATGLLEIRRGTNVLNAGLVAADILRMTNGGLGKFEFNGGTLSVKSSRIAIGNVFTIGNGISPATLLFAGNGTHDISGTLGLIISSNATLTGNGSLVGFVNVMSGGKLIPGTSVGKISLSTPPFFAGTIAMEISKNGTVLTNDQVQVTGTLTYGGALIVTNLGPTALAAGDRFPLFNASSYGGSFSVLNLPQPGPGLNWTNKLLLDGSIEVVTWSGPKIGSVAVSGTNLILSVTDGFPGGAYDVLTATNILTPLTNWLTLSSGTFDSFGNTTVTNGIALTESQRYFRIRIP